MASRHSSTATSSTGTAASAGRLYYENAHAVDRPTEPTTVPIGLAGFGGDFSGIRRFAEREGSRVSFNKEARRAFLDFATSPEASWAGNFRDLAASVTDVGGTLGVKVLSTPGMIAMMERNSAILSFEALPDGKATVGFEVCIKHVAGATEGAVCTAWAKVREVADGRKWRFDVEVREGDRTIGVGTHERRVIDVGVADADGNLGHFVVGRVVSAEPHPNADRLQLCRVDVDLGDRLPRARQRRARSALARGRGSVRGLGDARAQCFSSQAGQFADRLLLLARGRPVAAGRPDVDDEHRFGRHSLIMPQPRTGDRRPL